MKCNDGQFNDVTIEPMKTFILDMICKYRYMFIGELYLI